MIVDILRVFLRWLHGLVEAYLTRRCKRRLARQMEQLAAQCPMIP
jgi:hypothetical protein